MANPKDRMIAVLTASAPVVPEQAGAGATRTATRSIPTGSASRWKSTGPTVSRVGAGVARGSGPRPTSDVRRGST